MDKNGLVKTRSATKCNCFCCSMIVFSGSLSLVSVCFFLVDNVSLPVDPVHSVGT